MKCFICGKSFEPNSERASYYRKTGRAYCSIECSKKYRSELSSKVMAETNRRYAAERMKRNNPMAKPEVREKMIASLKRKGHKPIERGGNGKLTRQQDALAKALGWTTEFAIRTGGIMGAPNSYKVDIALPASKLAIEVDGHSHTLPKKREEDRKKEAVLASLGWKIKRFWNKEIDDDIADCVQKAQEALF